jgi:hypothetical protein
MPTFSPYSGTLRAVGVLALGASSVVACSSEPGSGREAEDLSPGRASSALNSPGGPPPSAPTVYHHPGGSISCIASDGSNVFLYDANAGVVQAPLAGGSPVVLMSLQSSPLTCRGMTVAGNRVLWITSDTTLWEASVGSAGSGAKVITVFPPHKHGSGHEIFGLAANPGATDAYFVVNQLPDGSPFAFAEHCTLSATPACNMIGAPTVEASSIGPAVLYVGRYVLWNFGGNLTVFDAAFEQVVGHVPGLNTTQALFTDGTHVYWPTHPSGSTAVDFDSLEVSPTLGGPSLVSSLLPPTSIGLAADATYIYVADPTDQGIAAIPLANPTSRINLFNVGVNTLALPPLLATGGRLVGVAGTDTVWAEAAP